MQANIKRSSQRHEERNLTLETDHIFKKPMENKDPLVKTPFNPLPLGSIKAKGWLLKQLELQRDGATGYAEQLYEELGENSAWLGGDAPDSDWERPVYYLKGLIPLAYTLSDQKLIRRSEKWVNAILNSQQENGFFGPKTNDDWWPRMIALYVLKDYYEATGDERVIPFMTAYFSHQIEQLPQRPLREWGKMRVGDNIDIVLWLYNQTEDQFLLELADLLAKQGYPITDIFTDNTFQTFGDDFHPTHTVNVNQSIKMPAIYYQRSHAKRDREAFIKGVGNLSTHNQITDMNAGTEMLAGLASTQGVELCAIVERIYSNSKVAMILGDSNIGDSLEKITFNALPGALDKEFKNHQYYSLPNQVESDYADHGFKQDYYNGTMPSPISGFPCCRFNMHMGWPYFIKNMWAATSDGGVGVIAYGPSQVSVRLNDADVIIKETTNYPFEDQITFDITTSNKVKFPLKLRIPQWTNDPIVMVNDEEIEGVKAGEYFSLKREWMSGDKVVLKLPMKVKASTWINNSVGIERGPLVYSLKLDEKWLIKDKAVPEKEDFDFSAHGFNEYHVKTVEPWNYGLLIDRKNPEKSIDTIQEEMPDNPFEQKVTPIKLVVKAKEIPSWHKSINKVEANEPPVGPIYSDQATKSIYLVPYGAQNIRVTYFPEVTENPNHTDVVKYEAENAEIHNAEVTKDIPQASGGSCVSIVDHVDSHVKFNSVVVEEDGYYNIDIWFANGNGYHAATGKVVVNDVVKTVTFQGTRDWGRFMATKIEVKLNKGSNTIMFLKNQGLYQLDYIVVRPL